MRKQTISIATAALAVALLAGCSSGGSGGTGGSSAAPTATKTTAVAAQTKQEACSQLENEFRTFIASQSSSTAPSDPKARATLITELTDRLDTAIPEVGNASVKSAFEDFNVAAKQYGKTLRSSGATESDSAKQALTNMQTSLQEVTAACPS